MREIAFASLCLAASCAAKQAPPTSPAVSAVGKPDFSQASEACRTADDRCAEIAAAVRKACDDGDPGGCGELGVLVAYGKAEAEGRIAIALLDGACRNDYARACVFRGKAERSAGEPGRARHSFELACRQGNADGCHYLGIATRDGEGGAADPKRAVSHFEQGCRLGSAESCYSLGAAYGLGQGVTQDDARAARSYETSCNAGFATACNSLGLMLAEGLGVPRDEARAATLFARACALGSADGCQSQQAAR